MPKVKDKDDKAKKKEDPEEKEVKGGKKEKRSKNKEKKKEDSSSSSEDEADKKEKPKEKKDLKTKDADRDKSASSSKKKEDEESKYDGGVNKKHAPYLDGDKVSEDSGPVLSVFALTEIMQKIRSNQAEMATEAPSIDGAIPEVASIISGIKGLLENKHYEVKEAPPTSFRTLGMQSHDFVLQVDKYYEEMSEVGGVVDETKPHEFYGMILEKIRHLRKTGSFVIRGIKTRDYRGMEIAETEALGVDFTGTLSHLIAADRQVIQNALDGMIVENGQVADRAVDVFLCAMSEPVYRIFNRLQAYIEGVQVHDLRVAMEWLGALGRRKRIEFSESFLTDFRRRDTVYILALRLPINPRVIWDVPRCYIANLIMNVALCLPIGEYVTPNPKISSITITQRITQTNPFAMMSGMTPTAMQMDDVRKIYLALMFPGQIILDLKADSSHSIDPVVRMVGGLLGHLMFTFGPRFTNITSTMARHLDNALSDFFSYMYTGRIPIYYGPTGQPLDFRIGLRNPYDCNGLRGDPQTGRGYNGWAIVDVVHGPMSPYDTVQRLIRYCDIDAREIIDPRTYGTNMQYPMYTEMVRALVAAGKEQEAAFLRCMLPFHMIRFARVNQVINEDLLSAFSLPDDQFNALLPNMLRGVYEGAEPLVLEVSWASVWFAFNRRFEPIQRNELLPYGPVIESIYASEISVIQFDVSQLRMLRNRFPDTLINATPSQFWKAALKIAPTPISDLMNLSHSFLFVNVRDVIAWSESNQRQPSLALTLEREAWAIAADIEELMLVDHVYFHRTMLPEPRLDDIDEFRREGFYHTNAMNAPPNILDITNYDYAVSLLQANLGQFKSALRRILDAGGWVRFGGMLRNIKIQFFEARPDDSILTELPYVYDEREEQGLRFVSLKYAKTATLYYLVYKVEYSHTPDALVNLNPTFTMTKIFINKAIVRKVRAPDMLNVVRRRVVAYKRKMRLMDITEAMKLGTPLAKPTA
ncbi:VP3 [Lebombo virus]|uniref:VP3 n=1 Tax=Lebombo virus TaxID=40057 RepID=W5QLX3_9REOV|nr:VP3 [Lebombo virus]AFX73377.1 VP3 [Lebombo virus]